MPILAARTHNYAEAIASTGVEVVSTNGETDGSKALLSNIGLNKSGILFLYLGK
ncbi:hypothetical protein SAMD00079811_45380 [Scytonema sp. HK-05]|uniref:hypothetical protein n=1 Tax=Scytonema sp. HK-05 TaxID=1137095 RepID=UPI000ACB73A5|nr:hypothetical protein [Scytonema sp. HK-05]BAY46922.1 hypothetical protein SAMD00079811_45380 [Scytonema sp. HK-05]